MGNDNEILSGEWNEVPDTDTEVQVPEPSKEVATIESAEEHVTTREELEAEAEAEGRLEIALSDLEDRDELTLDDLRTLPDAELFSDEELLAMARATGLVKGDEETESTEVTAPRAWHIVNDKGQDITANTLKMSVAEFLKSGAKIGYRAMNTNQSRSFDELVRLAQLGHLNESKIGQLVQDRSLLARQNSALVQEVNRANEIAVAWRAILADQTGVAFLKAQERYLKELATPTSPVTAEAPEVVEARGFMWYQQNVVPALVRIADVYNAKVEELDKLAQWMIAQEPAQLLNPERVQAIINTELISAIEQAGYVANPEKLATIVPSVGTHTNGLTPQAIVPSINTPNKAAELKLRAENANLRRQLSKQKVGKAPGAGNRGAPPLREGGTTEKLETALSGMSAEQARRYLRDLK